MSHVGKGSVFSVYLPVKDRVESGLKRSKYAACKDISSR